MLYMYIQRKEDINISAVAELEKLDLSFSDAEERHSVNSHYLEILAHMKMRLTQELEYLDREMRLSIDCNGSKYANTIQKGEGEILHSQQVC
jgi:hypothetical protein